MSDATRFLVEREGAENLILCGPERESFESDEEFAQAEREWAEIASALRERREPVLP